MIESTSPSIKCVIVYDRKLYGCSLAPTISHTLLDQILPQLKIKVVDKSRIRPVVFKSPRDMQFLDSNSLDTLKDGTVIHLLRMPRRNSLVGQARTDLKEVSPRHHQHVRYDRNHRSIVLL